MSQYLMKKLGTLFNELETISEDLLKQENKVYFLVIYFIRIVEQNYIIVLLTTLQQIKTFIDVPIIKTIPQMLVLVIILEILL